ncbi:MAG: (2Fe-2S)-binding protein [Candidatus Kapabacteria bacterium]|nr:(2Fe-2S)-binding protein [Candidatus Kapabacteria bacterium]
MILNINNQEYNVKSSTETPLLWVLRDELGLLGTKYGCGIGVCGTCAVLIDGRAERSCIFPVSSLENSKIITIEGLSPEGLNKLQQAWVDIGVSQCGYCQPGQIITAQDLLNQKPNPTDDDIDTAMSNNICRCGTYNKIRQAIHLAAKG